METKYQGKEIRRHLIKVNQPFNKNQVYASREDFDFVLEWIRARCPKAK